MMGSFRKIFFPTPEEEAEMCREAIRLHEEQIGHCSTCMNLDPSIAPGFVTDYGACRLKKEFFPEKVCGLTDHNCDGYVEDRVPADRARARLAELRPIQPVGYVAEDEASEFTKEQWDWLLRRFHRKE